MIDQVIVIGSAFWLGILTSISPCPLATNIAAVSYIGRRLDDQRGVMGAGLMYTLGRMLAYIALGAVVVYGLMSTPKISMMLQQNMNKILGPVLIVTGMFLLELISLPRRGGGISAKLQSKVERSGIWGAALLGVLFAMSLCPVSAALFFGSLIPLALKAESGLLLPGVYGLGTGLPVIVFAWVMAFSAGSLGNLFGRIQTFEKWFRRLTGTLIILIGIWYCLRYIFHLI